MRHSPAGDLRDLPCVFESLRLRWLRHKLERVWWRTANFRWRSYWAARTTISEAGAHDLLRAAVDSKKPFCVGRIGTIEGLAAHWASPDMPGLRPIFAQTFAAPILSGIRPRNRPSFRRYAEVLKAAIREIDLMAVWKTSIEAALLTETGSAPPAVGGEILSPTWVGESNWVSSLAGKRVLVVSPFSASIVRQMERFHEVWEGRFASFEVIPVQFPYLVEPGFSTPWWEVYSQIGKRVTEETYDIALFGCGALGLPLAALAKRSGRVGVHLGGHLQLIFGIYGTRHIEQEWHRRWINEAWVRPDHTEVPTCAESIEGRCYW